MQRPHSQMMLQDWMGMEIRESEKYRLKWIVFYPRIANIKCPSSYHNLSVSLSLSYHFAFRSVLLPPLIRRIPHTHRRWFALSFFSVSVRPYIKPKTEIRKAYRIERNSCCCCFFLGFALVCVCVCVFFGAMETLRPIGQPTSAMQSSLEKSAAFFGGFHRFTVCLSLGSLAFSQQWRSYTSNKTQYKPSS